MRIETYKMRIIKKYIYQIKQILFKNKLIFKKD